MLINFNYQDISYLFFFSYTLSHRWVWPMFVNFIYSSPLRKIHAKMAKRVLFAPNT